MTMAAIYCRVSTLDQADNASLATQESQCRRYAAEHGYTVDDRYVFRETHTGAELHERPKLTFLRAAVRQHEISVVICHAVDRLSRNQAHLYILAEELDQSDIRLEFVTEDFENSAVGKFVRSAKAFAAEVEREKLTERTYRGTLARARAGKPLCGPKPPYGYLWNDDKSAYQIDSFAGAIVQRIFREAGHGRSLRAIAIGLGDDGIPSPGHKPHWHFTTVRLILRNSLYVGEAAAFRTKTVRRKGGGYRMTRRPESEHITLPAGVAPPLVDRATFDVVQARLRFNQLRAARNNKTPENALLRAGFIRCGHCQNRMGVDTQQGRSVPFYRCTRKDHVGGCGGCSVRVPIADAFVWDRVRSILLDPEIIASEVRRLQANDPTEQDLAELEQAFAAIVKQQERAARALTLLDDEAAAPVVAQLHELSNRRRVLGAEREALCARRAEWDGFTGRLGHIQALAARIAVQLDTLTYQERRMALDALGVRVKAFRPEHGSRLIVEMDLPVTDESIVLHTASA
jgi:site-specific DNA recombinase